MSPPPGADTESIRRQMEELGLPPYQSRVLVVLLMVGSANSAQLSELSGVSRTSIYKVMDALAREMLVEPVPTHGPTVWTTHGWHAVLDTLDAAAYERLHQHRARTSRLRDTLSNRSQEGGPASARDPVPG